MKKAFLVFVAILSMLVVSIAQNTKPTKAEIQVQRNTNLENTTIAAKEAGLNEKELEKLKTIFENLYKKQDEIYDDTTLMKDVRKEKLKEANDAKDWKVKSLFGDRYTAYVDARKRIIAEAALKKQ